MIYILDKHLQKKYIFAFYRYVFSLYECLQNRSFDIKIIRQGNITNPRGSIKKGGNNNDVNKPRIKNLKKIN